MYRSSLLSPLTGPGYPLSLWQLLQVRWWLFSQRHPPLGYCEQIFLHRLFLFCWGWWWIEHCRYHWGRYQLSCSIGPANQTNRFFQYPLERSAQYRDSYTLRLLQGILLPWSQNTAGQWSGRKAGTRSGYFQRYPNPYLSKLLRLVASRLWYYPVPWLF